MLYTFPVYEYSYFVRHLIIPFPITVTPELRAEYGLRHEVIRKVYAGVLLEAITEAIETCNREPELQGREALREGSSQA